jgi:nucleotide-binding universal stress UspA family protein
MYKRILVAVDGSATGERALAEAIRLAAEANGQLRIVHAVELVNVNWDVEMPEPTEIWEWMTQSGREILRRAEAVARAAGVNVDTRLIEITTLGQRIPEAIAAEADTWPADLIVIGTHGRRGLSRLLLGSVAEGVVRVAKKPVLLIRGES